MACKRKLSGRRKDTHMPRVSRFCRKYERRLGEIELTSDLLHLLARQAICLRQHGQLISTEARLGEHIADVITVFHNAFRTVLSLTTKLTKKTEHRLFDLQTRTLELALVLGDIEVAARFGDQAGIVNLP